jgi:hypothetical protein
MGHPDDIWYTPAGSTVRMLVVDGRELEIARLTSLYIYSKINIEEFEARVAEVLGS